MPEPAGALLRPGSGMFAPMFDITWPAWAFAALIAGALLTGRHRVAKIAAVLAVLAGIGIGMDGGWAEQVWPVIGDVMHRLT